MLISIEKQLLYLVASGDGRGEGASVGQLVEVYEARGISHQVVRNSLASLKKGGYVASSERSRYTATSLGQEFIQMINRKPLLAQEQWNGRWCMVLFEIPETERRVRDRLRSELLQLGFGALYKSVYVSPWDYREEVIRLCEESGMAGWVTVTETVIVHNGITPERAAKLWPLEQLRDIYVKGEAWFREEFEPGLLAAGSDGQDGGLSLFVRFLELGERIAEFGLNDPMLPVELLPEDWPGRNVMGQMVEGLRSIAQQMPEGTPYRAFVNRFLSVR